MHQNHSQQIPRHVDGRPLVETAAQDRTGHCFFRAKSMPLQRPSTEQIL
jgi:hypothetical protein